MASAESNNHIGDNNSQENFDSNVDDSIGEAALEVRLALEELQRLEQPQDQQQELDMNVVGSRNELDQSPLSYDYSSGLDFHSQSSNFDNRQSKIRRVDHCRSSYQYRRVARKLDRSLDKLESLLNEYASANNDNENNEINNQNSMKLSQEMIDDLIGTLATVTDKQANGRNSGDLCVAAPENGRLSQTNALSDANTVLYKACAERSSRLLIKYGTFPLEEQYFDSLIDHLANFFSHFQCYGIARGQSNPNFEHGVDLEPLVCVINFSLIHSTSNVILTKDESIRLLDILISQSLIHLTSRWQPATSGTLSPFQFDIQGNGRLHWYSLQIRILVTFLLNHLHKQLENFEDNNGRNSEDSREQEENYEKKDIPPQFIMRVQQYSQELIEYALDSLEGSGAHYYHLMENSETKLRKAKDTLEAHFQKQRSTSTTSSSLHASMALQEAMVHVSLTVQTVQILQKINRHIPTQNPLESLNLLFTSFSTFMANFSVELEESMKTTHVLDEMKFVNAFMFLWFSTPVDIATAVLRLSSLSPLSSKMDATNKDNNCRQDEHCKDACIITLLQALKGRPEDFSLQSSEDQNEYKSNVLFLLQHCLHMEQKQNRGNLNSSFTNASANDTQNLTHVLQVAAVAFATGKRSSRAIHSPINLSQGSENMNPSRSEEFEKQPNDLQKFLEKQAQISTRESNLSHICDALLTQNSDSQNSILHKSTAYNPWHSLVARKLRESLNVLGHLTEQDAINKYCQTVRPFMSTK